MSVLSFEEVDGFEVAVEVGTAWIVPGVGGVVDVLVGPEVGEEDFAGVGADVGEGVEDVAIESA